MCYIAIMQKLEQALGFFFSYLLTHRQALDITSGALSMGNGIGEAGRQGGIEGI